MQIATIARLFKGYCFLSLRNRFHSVKKKEQEIIMNILTKLEAYIEEFNSLNNESFNIDTIRIEFSKQHKLSKLKEIGKWKKIAKNSSLIPKLKKRLLEKEITSVYRLDNYNIYFYNSNRDRPKYRKAILVIFGMYQYNKKPIPKELIIKIINILKNITSIDICIDINKIPNFNELKKYYTLTKYNKQISSQTHYINDTGVLMIDSIVLYDKALKNNLKGVLWRIEATISIPNIKYLALPLYEFKQIVDIARI